MSLPFIVFFVFAAVAVPGALILIVAKDPIHSALSLIVVMISLAGLYLLLGAEFIAAVQIIVYAGAIMVLFVFVIMLLNAGAEERTNLSRWRAMRACRWAFSCCWNSRTGCARSAIGQRNRQWSLARRPRGFHRRYVAAAFPAVRVPV